MWCIGEIDGEYRERMYDLLDLYQEPYNTLKPVVGMDERPKQLLGDRKRIPMKPGSPERYDYEYVRKGKVNIFVAVEPKAGKRDVEVTDRRTKRDFALYRTKQMASMILLFPLPLGPTIAVNPSGIGNVARLNDLKFLKLIFFIRTTYLTPRHSTVIKKLFRRPFYGGVHYEFPVSAIRVLDGDFRSKFLFEFRHSNF